MATVMAVSPSAPPTGVGGLSSVAGLLALLQEGGDSAPLQKYALDNLSQAVDLFWHEIAESITEIERLAEEPTFQYRQLASLVVSRVYFHLGEFDLCLHYALGAEDLLDISVKSEYVRTVVAKSVEEFVALEAKRYVWGTMTSEEQEGMTPPKAVDPRLEKIFFKMVERSLSEGDEKQALGVALEARRLDKVEDIVRRSTNLPGLLQFCLSQCHGLILHKRFRNEFMELLVKIASDAFESPSDLEREYSVLCQTLFYTGDVDRVAEILRSLLRYTDESALLIAYQTAFDLVELENSAFLHDLLNHRLLRLPGESTPSSQIDVDQSGESQPQVVTEATEGAPAITVTAPHVGDSTLSVPASVNGVSQQRSDKAQSDMEDEAEYKSSLLPAALLAHNSPPAPASVVLHRKKVLRRILSGDASTHIFMRFLHMENHSDLPLLHEMKSSMDPRSTIVHNALVVAHGFMVAGTCCDTFFRTNAEWLGRAVCWAKFTVTASIGNIHQGRVGDEPDVIFSAYQSNTNQGVYADAGVLYARGLIFANRNNEACNNTLLQELRNSQSRNRTNYDIIQHGACLGIGLNMLGSGSQALYEELKTVLFTDSAVAGEAAGYAMGLVMLGTGNMTVIQDLLSYAHDTQHEKIIRACAIAVAFVLYRREEDANAVISEMVEDKDSLIRYGAMFAYGMAYCGTGNNTAVRKLLHVSVSDVSDDVRRAAVIALGFILCNVPEQVPRMLNLLSDGFNPHVRYGAAMAVGISCAGSARQDAVNLLMPLTQDTCDFVRQAALMSLSLVLMQASESALPDDAVLKIRTMITRTAGDKQEDVVARFGAILAYGIIDAGGRNVIASFFSATGHLRREAAVGFCLFSQLWYWYPLVHCLSLCFRPSAMIGVTTDMIIPSDFEVRCYCKPELYAYPAAPSREQREEKKAVVTAVLSTTAKRHQQLKRQGSASSDAAAFKRSESAASQTETKKDEAKGEAESSTKANQESANSSSSATPSEYQTLKNPCRVLPQQDRYLDLLVPGARYVPVLKARRTGILMLNDLKPNSRRNGADLYELVVGEKRPEPEVSVPEPLVWDGTLEEEEEDEDQDMKEVPAATSSSSS